MPLATAAPERRLGADLRTGSSASAEATYGAPMADIPVPVRWMLLGAVVFGIVGGVLGLVLGLAAYPPTAWFAVFEVGVPAAFLGALLGLATGTIAWGIGRSRGTPA